MDLLNIWGHTHQAPGDTRIQAKFTTADQTIVPGSQDLSVLWYDDTKGKVGIPVGHASAQTSSVDIAVALVKENIPEPSSLALTILCLLSFAFIRNTA